MITVVSWINNILFFFSQCVRPTVVTHIKREREREREKKKEKEWEKKEPCIQSTDIILCDLSKHRSKIPAVRRRDRFARW